MLRGFISYAHEDREECEQLSRHLAPLRDAGIIDFWADKQIFPGSKWATDIHNALERCDVAAFLVSSNLYHSEYVRQTELPRALQRSESGQCIVVPVLLKSFLFECFEGLRDLQPLPLWDRFIDDWSPTDAALMLTAKGFMAIAQEKRRHP